MLKFKTIAKTLPAAVLILGSTAYAAIPETAKAAIESAKTDGLEIGWLVLGVFAALFVIGIGRRLIR